MAGTGRLCRLSATILGLLLTAVNQASAGTITSLNSSAPGETTLAIDPTHPNFVDYTAIFTRMSPITFTIGVSGPGKYSLAPPNNASTNNVSNATGIRWTAFDIDVGPGAHLSSFGFSSLATWSSFSFGSPPPFTNLHLFDGPGLAPGGSVYINSGVTVTGRHGPPVGDRPLPPVYIDPGITVTGRADSPATFQVTLTPTASPEPSTLVLASTAVTLTGAGYWWHRRRRRAPGRLQPDSVLDYGVP